MCTTHSALFTYDCFFCLKEVGPENISLENWIQVNLSENFVKAKSCVMPDCRNSLLRHMEWITIKRNEVFLPPYLGYEVTACLSMIFLCVFFFFFV